MNTKTTLFLAVALVVLVGMFWMAGGGEPVSKAPAEAPTELLGEKNLIAEDFGQVAKLTCKTRDGAEWSFVRSTDDGDTTVDQWQLAAPIETKAAAWQVNGIVRKIQNLKYKVKYSPDDAGAVSPADAGLVPPRAVVTLEGDDGQTVTVEVGNTLGDNRSYVRLAGSTDIYAVSPSLDKLLKDKAIEYRDQQLVKVDAAQVKKLEITQSSQEGGPAKSVLVRSDGGWTFESPFKAAAVADKLDTAVRTLASLRVTNWVEAQSTNLAMYGLAEPALTIRVTIEEPPAPAESDDQEAETETDEADEGAEPEPEPVIREVVVHISDQSPIGDTTKVYVRKGDETAVGTISKSLADRMTPSPSEWRDMRLASADTAKADRIELATPSGTANFVKRQGNWTDADTAARVDQAAMADLLNAVKNLKALNFVDAAETGAGSFGFDAPQASVRMNIPGRPDAERIVVGGFTDARTRRVVYVRRSDDGPVAKVRVGDVANLIRGPASYRDRTVFELKSGRFERIAITRNDELAGGTFTFALTSDDGRLEISEPARAPTSAPQVNKLTAALASLKAMEVVADGEAASVGLEQPVVTCEITYRPSEITKFVEVEQEPPEPATEQDQTGQPSADQADQAAEEQTESATDAGGQEAQPKQPKLRPEQHQPPDETYTLKLAEHDGKVYAMRQDQPTVYQLPRSLLNLLRAEYHEPAILDFEESQVVTLTVTEPDGTAHVLAKVDGIWKYQPEPDLPIDPKRVQDLLLRLKDLKTQRYVAYQAADLSQYGLDQAWKSAAVTLEDGREQRFIVSARVCDADPQKRHYAALAGQTAVLLISNDTIQRFKVDLAELEAP